jgi:hypothetical protein
MGPLFRFLAGELAEGDGGRRNTRTWICGLIPKRAGPRLLAAVEGRLNQNDYLSCKLHFLSRKPRFQIRADSGEGV